MIDLKSYQRTFEREEKASKMDFWGFLFMNAVYIYVILLIAYMLAYSKTQSNSHAFMVVIGTLILMFGMIVLSNVLFDLFRSKKNIADLQKKIANEDEFRKLAEKGSRKEVFEFCRSQGYVTFEDGRGPLFNIKKMLGDVRFPKYAGMLTASMLKTIPKCYTKDMDIGFLVINRVRPYFEGQDEHVSDLFADGLGVFHKDIEKFFREDPQQAMP